MTTINELDDIAQAVDAVFDITQYFRRKGNAECRHLCSS